MRVVWVLLLVILVSGCNNDEDEPCECELVTFRTLASNGQPDSYVEFPGRTCISWYEEFTSYDISRMTSPITITGPTQEQVQIYNDKNGLCD